MRSADWRVLRDVFYIIGVSLLFGCVFAYAVPPVHDYAIPLLAAGIALLVVGFVSDMKCMHGRGRGSRQQGT